jgi:hypothetical protein
MANTDHLSHWAVRPIVALSLIAGIVTAMGLSVEAQEAAPAQPQETVLVPEQYTTYRLVYETTFEERRQVQYKPVWQQTWDKTPRFVGRPVQGPDGMVYMQQVLETQMTSGWSCKMVPQETTANTPVVKAFWKPYATKRMVPRQVPAGTPAPPTSLKADGKDDKSNDTPGSTDNDKNDQQDPKLDPDNLKDELKKLQSENNRLRDTLKDLLGSGTDREK